MKAARDLALLLALPALLVACGDLEPAVEVDGASTESPATDPTAAPGTETVTAAGLAFDLPDDWRVETPDSPMRQFQAKVPGTAGEGLLTLFFFGPGGGGGVDANIQRWVDQMEAPEGVEPDGGRFESNGLTVNWVEHTGTLKASRIGSFPETDQPDYRLQGAVLEGPGGPWFFKLVGPDATLLEQRDAFEGLLRSARVAGS